MSWLNQQMICLECAEREEGHPKYKEAREAERKAMKAGNYNSKLDFYGVGKASSVITRRRAIQLAITLSLL